MRERLEDPGLIAEAAGRHADPIPLTPEQEQRLNFLDNKWLPNIFQALDETKNPQYGPYQAWIRFKSRMEW